MMMMISSILRPNSLFSFFFLSTLVVACLGISRSHTKKTQDFGHLLKKDYSNPQTHTHNIEKKDSFVERYLKLFLFIAFQLV